MCSWTNTQNANVDKLDWELTSQEEEQHYPTPAGDHTQGTEKGEPEEHQQGFFSFGLHRIVQVK